MKKILFFSFLILVSMKLISNTAEKENIGLSSMFSAGYVFKHDSVFKNIYGHGMINAITADVCYNPWRYCGIGAKLSYWRARGRTIFLKKGALLQEIPITLYVRGNKKLQCGLQLYAALGAGFAWIKERSYLCDVRLYKGIGELEVGLQYPIWRYINIMSAFRYVFPPQSQLCKKIDVGGCDLRIGLGFSF